MLEGFYLYSSFNNILSGNLVTGNKEYAIDFTFSSGNILSDNMMRNNTWGVLLSHSSDNIWFGNTIMGQKEAVRIDVSSGNRFFHNNFSSNKWQIDNWLNWTNTWDNGSEGNYWSDYDGTDSNHDGIGDTPYIIDANNTDHYPLMNVIPEFPTLLILPAFMIMTALAMIVHRRKTKASDVT